MKFGESKSGKLVFARLFENEDILETTTKVAEKTKVSTGFFFLIGTLKKANLGFFRSGQYETTEMNQPLEIVSCLGNISTKENKTFAHAHISVSDEKGRVFGGHVMPGCSIGDAGELALMEAKGIRLPRKFDEKTKLYLWTISGLPAKVKKKSREST